MNRILVVIFVALSIQTYAQERVVLEKPTVDRRTELLSIVFRFAGRPEYSSKDFKLYYENIERHFEKFKNHELIQFTKSIMGKNFLQYNAPMSMAINLDDEFNLLTDVRGVWQYTGWTQEDAKKFVLLLQQFAKDTEFDKFFNDNADLYAEAIRRYIPVYERVDINWYRTFFGKEINETLSIIICLGNGSANYADALYFSNGSRIVYVLMGASESDSIGFPEFNVREVLPVLLHEFIHEFAPQLFGNTKDHPLRESGEKLFSVVKDEMTLNAYTTWTSMFNEAIVEASVIKYMKDNRFEQSEIERQIKLNKIKGCLWIEEFVDELESYDRQRNQYPTLDSYMPRLIEAHKIWADNIQSMADKRPKVISIDEFENGSQNVNSDIKTITINFNMPLSGNGHSVYPFMRGMDAFPYISESKYANNNQSVVLEVSLEKGKEYQFILVGENYTSVDGDVMKMYEVNFKTEK